MFWCSTCPSVGTSPLTSCRLRLDVPRGLAHDPFLLPVCHRVNLASHVFVSCFGFAAWRSTPLWRNFPNILYSTSGCASRVQYLLYAPPRLFPSIRNRRHPKQVATALEQRGQCNSVVRSISRRRRLSFPCPYPLEPCARLIPLARGPPALRIVVPVRCR